MPAYVIRHANAGDRAAWEGDDRLRPLTKSGRRQAEAIAQRLKDEPIGIVLSSPYLRCVQSVEPLATAKHLTVTTTEELAEGAGGIRIVELVKRYQDKHPAMCTHGDLVEELLEILVERGLISRARAANEKGGIWVLQDEKGEITGAKYLGAP